MATLNVVVKEKHLDKALHALSKYDKHYVGYFVRSCVLAQAVKDHTRQKDVTVIQNVRIYRPNRLPRTYVMDDTGNAIRHMFDAEQYAKIRSLLPVTIKLKGS